MARSPRMLANTAQAVSYPTMFSEQIIEQLKKDSRRSYAAIGKAVRVCEAAVRQRVLRLQDAGVMQIVAVTDPLTLGFRRQVRVRAVRDQHRDISRTSDSTSKPTDGERDDILLLLRHR